MISYHIQYVERFDSIYSTVVMRRRQSTPNSSFFSPLISHYLLSQVHPLSRSLLTCPSVLLGSRSHNVFFEVRNFNLRLTRYCSCYVIDIFLSNDIIKEYESYLPFLSLDWNVLEIFPLIYVSRTLLLLNSIHYDSSGNFLHTNHRRRPYVNYNALLRNIWMIYSIRFLRDSVAINM